MKTYTVIEADPQWMENEYRIHCINSMAREGLLQFKDGKVTCTGVQNDSASKYLKELACSFLCVLIQNITYDRPSVAMDLSTFNGHHMWTVSPFPHKIFLIYSISNNKILTELLSMLRVSLTGISRERWK